MDVEHQTQDLCHTRLVLSCSLARSLSLLFDTVAQSGLKLMILLPQFSDCWDCRQGPHLTGMGVVVVAVV